MDAWLSQYPTREIDEPATKDFVRAEIGLVRTDMAELRTELKTEIGELRTSTTTTASDLKTEIGELRTAVEVGFAELRGEMDTRFKAVDAKFAELRTDLGGQIGEMSDKLQSIIRHQLYWLLGTGLTMTLTILAFLAASGRLQN